MDSFTDSIARCARDFACEVGVFDGHGEKGRRISELARTSITRTFLAHKELHSDPTAALETAFFETQDLIERRHSTAAQHSGTTAVAAYQHRNRLFVANVGDSRAVLGRSDGRSSSSVLRAIELSSDQRPGRADERQRILAEGGVVAQSSITLRNPLGGRPRILRVGPERVWDRTGCCGLQVTRSLGDLSMHPYVTSQPEVSERELDARDRLLILGTDGIWDRIGSQEAIDIAFRYKDPGAAARELTSVARQRWRSETSGQMSDDITAVVVNLDYAEVERGDMESTSSKKSQEKMNDRGGTTPKDRPRPVSKERISDRNTHSRERRVARLPELSIGLPPTSDRQRLSGRRRI